MTQIDRERLQESVEIVRKVIPLVEGNSKEANFKVFSVQVRAIEDLLDLAKSYLVGSLFATEEEIVEKLKSFNFTDEVFGKLIVIDRKVYFKLTIESTKQIAHVFLNQIPIERRAERLLKTMLDKFMSFTFDYEFKEYMIEEGIPLIKEIMADPKGKTAVEGKEICKCEDKNTDYHLKTCMADHPINLSKAGKTIRLIHSTLMALAETCNDATLEELKELRRTGTLSSPEGKGEV
jgi:hypothetical protein